MAFIHFLSEGMLACMCFLMAIMEEPVRSFNSSIALMIPALYDILYMIEIFDCEKLIGVNLEGRLTTCPDDNRVRKCRADYGKILQRFPLHEPIQVRPSVLQRDRLKHEDHGQFAAFNVIEGKASPF
mmetsp:Transcript_12273/g.24961  ORF Transcript_12273/g.24961 Transcript_12273/m.24961 type:complete len:127 (+) Transcript_12273:786-1166(+)